MANNLPMVTGFTLTGPDIKAPAPATKVINNVSVSTSDVQVDPSRNLWFRLFTPNTNSDTLLPLIIYFHGGGFCRFGPDTNTFDDLCSKLAAKANAVIASVNYRLTPDHKYPTQYEDGYDALKFIDAKNAVVLPKFTDVRNCFIGGDSAGGNIAHHVTVRALENVDQLDKVKIVGLLCLQPFFGGEERTESEMKLTNAPLINLDLTDAAWRDLLPEGGNRNHPAANVCGGGSKSEATKELMNLEFPPTLVIVGGNDPLQDWQKRYVEWLKSCGKKAELTMYPNAFHSFYAFPEVAEYDLLFQRLADFIQKHVNPK